MGKFLNEFKAFAVKGNAVDMAVGVIIGGAFGKIVSSIVDDVIMPPIGWLIGGVNFTDLKVTLPAHELGGEEVAAATLNYGNFIQTAIDFLIIAFCVFILVKGINRLARKNDVPRRRQHRRRRPPRRGSWARSATCSRRGSRRPLTDGTGGEAIRQEAPPRLASFPGKRPAGHGSGRRFSQRTFHVPSSGNPGFARSQPSHPAHIIAMAVSRPPLPGR